MAKAEDELTIAWDYSSNPANVSRQDTQDSTCHHPVEKSQRLLAET